MFKFLKTKKGFSLVELMIVVVIMAILVAVAIPIYNSVTGNAREKTCLDNQRQIMSAVTNILSMNGITGKKDGVAKVTFNYDANGNKQILEVDSFAVENFYEGSDFTIDTIKNAFQVIPVCGDDAQTLTLIITGSTGDSASVTVSCSDTEHQLAQGSAS